MVRACASAKINRGSANPLSTFENRTTRYQEIADNRCTGHDPLGQRKRPARWRVACQNACAKTLDIGGNVSGKQARQDCLGFDDEEKGLSNCSCGSLSNLQYDTFLPNRFGYSRCDPLGIVPALTFTQLAIVSSTGPRHRGLG